jgi:hypothetical protein
MKYRRWACYLLATFSLFLAACGPPQAREPNPTRAIDEGRAIKLIAQSLSNEGLSPLAPRSVSLSGGTKVRLDVGVDGHKLGIVYLTASDIDELGKDELAQRPASGDQLIIRTGSGQDTDMHIVILYASDYGYDDNVGADREATAITAENKLDRDVRDFVIIARKNHWP